MPTIIVDGQPVEMSAGATVLQAVRRVGAHLPTLCHLEGLPPYGACRLCLVEKVAPDRAVIAACAYPVEDGLAIQTAGPQAVAVRRLMLEFLLARCPTSTVIQGLAAEAGVTGSRFESAAAPDELCMLCGLCVRVCRDLVGAAAISFMDRGTAREVGAPFRLQAEVCIGCGACAAVCPTGAVSMKDADGIRVLEPWGARIRLRACPGCGQPYAPEPMAFLTGQVPVSAGLWGMCPKCRRQATVRQLDVVAAR